MTYAEVLRQLLEEKNVKPAELARMVGTNRSSIGSLLDGKAQEPKLRKAKKIADALDVSLEYFTDRMDM